MSVTTNEFVQAEEILQSNSLGKRPRETLGVLAKYYIYNGFNSRDTKSLLEAFVLQASPGASLVKWSDGINSAYKYAEKHPLIMIDGVEVTVPEMRKINSLKGKQQRRLAFTLLCLAKFYYKVNPKQSYWVNVPEAEIMRLANINTSVKRQGLLYHQLRDDGCLRFSPKVDSLSVQVMFVEDGETAMYVTDFRNLGNQYLMYMGEPYFACENCGLVIKIGNSGSTNRGRKVKYCPRCAPIVHSENTRECVYRKREMVT